MPQLGLLRTILVALFTLNSGQSTEERAAKLGEGAPLVRPQTTTSPAPGQ